jgi:hypothetical protein
MHLLDASPDDDGHAAWQAIIAWHGSAATSRFIIDHYRNKLESLRLNGSTEASAFVNDFIVCSQKLETKNEGYRRDKASKVPRPDRGRRLRLARPMRLCLELQFNT